MVNKLLRSEKSKWHLPLIQLVWCAYDDTLQWVRWCSRLAEQCKARQTPAKCFQWKKHSHLITGLPFVSHKWICLSFIMHLIPQAASTDPRTSAELVLSLAWQKNNGLNAHHFPVQHVNDQLQRPRGKETEAHKSWSISDEPAVSKSLQNEDRAYNRSQTNQERN